MKMSISGKFYFPLQLEVQTLIFLWSTAIINFLEIILYSFHFFEIDKGFWNIIGVSFYSVWTSFAVLFCAIGIGGIHELKPNFLKNHCVLYFLCSAICKAIFAIMLLVLPSGNGFYSCIEYASSEPLLLILIHRNIGKFATLPIIFSHVLAMFYLMYGAFIVHRCGNDMLKRNTKNDAVRKFNCMSTDRLQLDDIEDS